MKGMQKIKRGSGFLGVLTYATVRDTSTEWDGAVIGGNMLGISAAELATEFGLSRRIRPDIERPVWHNSLRLPQGDKATLDGWGVIADDYMRRMGFSENHQRAYILHDPEGGHGQHIHIVASRVSLTGEIYLGKNENLKSTKIISQLEKDYDLTITKGVDYNSRGKIVMPAVAAPSKAELDIAVKRGERSERIRIKDFIDVVMSDGSISASDFCDRLSLVGVRVLPNISEATGSLSGFSFGLVHGELSYSGSRIGAAYKLNGLKDRGLNYVKERDFQQLAAVVREFRGCSGVRQVARIAEAGLSDVSRGFGRHAGGGNEEHSVEQSNSSRGKFEGSSSGSFQNGQPVGRECTDAFGENLVAGEVNIRTADKADEAGEAFRARSGQDSQNKSKPNDTGNGSSRNGMFNDGLSAFPIANKDDALRRVIARIECRAIIVSGYLINITNAVNFVFRSACDELFKLRKEGVVAAEEASAKDPVSEFLNLDFVPNKSKSWGGCSYNSNDNVDGASTIIMDNDIQKNKKARSKSISDIGYYK
jgi:hypothetical protein